MTQTLYAHMNKIKIKKKKKKPSGPIKNDLNYSFSSLSITSALVGLLVVDSHYVPQFIYRL
jgi:hypothetical protein